jgi:D-galactose 1-dehydrogenase
MKPVRVAIVGLGKIARDQHLRVIASMPGIELAGIASRNAGLAGVPCFGTIEELLAGLPELDAVALCTPPSVRRGQAMAALAAGKHVLLEKPPGATVGELTPLVALAASRKVTLFAAWHSQFAPAVAPVRAILARHPVRRVRVLWKEDVRVWHPGQDWIFEPGGLGVFDPGINALSILTAILPEALFVSGAQLAFPANRQAPIAADLALATASGLRVQAAFDFRQQGEQVWSIEIETDIGRLDLTSGGAKLSHDGAVLVDEAAQEYRGVYERFLELIGTGASDVDVAPLALVADAFLLGRRAIVGDFVW